MGARRLISAFAVATLVLLSAGCTPPVPGDAGPVPTCPARQRFVVETTDQAGASVVRAISDNGQWLVTSRTFGDVVQLRLREVGSVDPGIVVGTIPHEPLQGHPVAVSDDGNRVVWDSAIVEGDQIIQEFHRWHRSSGTVDPLQPPDADHPVPAGLSLDGKVATWLSELPTVMPAYTQSLTDEVWTPDLDLEEHESVREALGYGQPPASSDEWFYTVASPDGRWWAVAYEYRFGFPTRLARWDVVTNELTVLRDGRFSVLDLQVADDGSILSNQYAEVGSFDVPGIQITSLDGTVRTLQSNPLLGFPGGDGLPQSRVFAATPDLRAVAFTELSSLPPRAQVVVSRCQ